MTDFARGGLIPAGRDDIDLARALSMTPCQVVRLTDRDRALIRAALDRLNVDGAE